MNARQPHPLAHVPTGLTIRWSRALDALYPEDHQGPTSAVTVEVGLLYGRLVVQLLPGMPWLDLSSLPDHVAAEVRFMEGEAYRTWRDQRDREQAAADREDRAAGEWDEWCAQQDYRRAVGF